MSAARRILMFISLATLGIGVHLLQNGSLDGALRLVTMLTMGISGIVLIVGTVLEVRQITDDWSLPEPEEPPSNQDVVIPRDPVERAVHAVENAESYQSETERRVRIDIDIHEEEE